MSLEVNRIRILEDQNVSQKLYFTIYPRWFDTPDFFKLYEYHFHK